jgi:hypothetical protein
LGNIAPEESTLENEKEEKTLGASIYWIYLQKGCRG